MSALISALQSTLQVANINPFTQSGQWMIVQSDSSSVALTPDTFVSLEYKGEQRIADYPIEEGGFSSYNKVAVPYDLRVVAACGGMNLIQQLTTNVGAAIDNVVNSLLGTSFNQPMTRPAFLKACDTMLQALTLYDVVTPDYTYQSVNCVGVRVSRTKDKGARMVYAELYFQEVRQTGSATYSNGSTPNVDRKSVV